MRAIPSFDLEDGSDFLDVELVEVSRLDFAEEYVLDLAGAEDRFSGHVLCALKPGLTRRKTAAPGGEILACEIYHKLDSGATLPLSGRVGPQSKMLLGGGQVVAPANALASPSREPIGTRGSHLL